MNENHTERLTPFDIARLLKASITPYNATSNILEYVDTIIHSKTKTGKNKHFAQLKQMLEEQDKSNITKDVISNLNEIEQIRRALILTWAMIRETHEKKDLQRLESLEEGIINVATEAYRDFLNNTTVTNEKGDTFIASNCTEIERYKSFRNRILHIYNTYSFAYTMAFSQLKLDRNTQMLCDILKQTTETKEGMDEVKEGVDEVKEGVDELRGKRRTTKEKQSNATKKARKESGKAEQDKVNKARLERAFELCDRIFETGKRGIDGKRRPPFYYEGNTFEKANNAYRYVIENYGTLCSKGDKTGRFGGKLGVDADTLKTYYHAYVRNLKAKGKNHESN